MNDVALDSALAESRSASRAGSTRRSWLLVVAAAGCLTLLGVLWLNAAGSLSATGTRIAELEMQREALQMRRARALVAHAETTNLRQLEERAKALGFGPAEDIAFVPVPGGQAAASHGITPLGVIQGLGDQAPTTGQLTLGPNADAPILARAESVSP